MEYEKLGNGFETIKIIRYYKTVNCYIDFNVSGYPFKRPYIITSNFVHYSHENSGIMQFKNNSFLNYRLASMNDRDTISELNENCCFHCRSILSCRTEWKPCYSFYHIFKQIKTLNLFISSVIKLEVLKRNYKYIPEDVIHYIITFLSIPINEIFEIDFNDGDTLKIVK